MRTWRLGLVGGAAVILLGCTRLVDGAAWPPPGQVSALPGGVDAHRIMLDTAQLRGIAGAGEELTIIPTMDARSPVDIDPLADTVPSQCRFVYAETAVFGRRFTQFHKITFQYPPKGALISEAAAAYPNADTARRAFDALVATVSGCADTRAGAMLVGDWRADATSLRTRPGGCGRDYRVKAAVLLEVTFCGFGESVADLVITNLAANVPS